MENESEPRRITARLLPALTRAREERLRLRIPLTRLSYESGISLARLSEAERNIRKLPPAKEARRREAIRRLKEAP